MKYYVTENYDQAVAALAELMDTTFLDDYPVELSDGRYVLPVMVTETDPIWLKKHSIDLTELTSVDFPQYEGLEY